MIDVIQKIRRIRKNTRSDRPVPDSIHVNLTGWCTCKCWHCEMATARKGKEIDYDKVLEVMDLAAGWGVPVLLSGGEPMLHTRFWDIVEYAHARKIPLKIVTSGVEFPKLDAERAKLLENAFTEFMISLDSAEAGEHDKLRGRPGLMEWIVTYVKGRKFRERVFLINVPAADFHNAGAVLDLAAELGVSVTYQPFIYETNFPDLPVNEDKDSIRQDMNKLHITVGDTVDALIAKAKRLGVHSNLDFIRTYIEEYYRYAGSPTYFATQVLDRFVCSIPWQQMTIDDSGVILPCVFLSGKNSVHDGDIYETWLKGALKYREEILGGAVYPQCKSCTCHFSSNHRNSVLAFPVANRRGLSVIARKFLSRRLRPASS